MLKLPRLPVNQAQGGRHLITHSVQHSEHSLTCLRGGGSVWHIISTFVQNEISQLFSCITTSVILEIIITHSTPPTPRHCCAPGINGHFSVFIKNRGHLSHKGKQEASPGVGKL